ncbi:MAG: hypothetical protein AAF449_22815 [Myxococcota bacterium]
MALSPVQVYDDTTKETVMTNRLLKGAFLLGAATALMAAGPAADLNQDGQVSYAEFKAAGDARFQAADTDFNGELTRDEMKALRENERAEKATEHFRRMDANGDGVVSEAEMLAARDARKERIGDRRGDRRAKLMERFDANGDGELSDTERAQARDAAKEMRAQRGERRKARGERPRLDANRDGVITRAEYDAMGEVLFARMDANGDGVLTQGEGRKARKGKRPGPRR